MVDVLPDISFYNNEWNQFQQLDLGTKEWKQSQLSGWKYHDKARQACQMTDTLNVSANSSGDKLFNLWLSKPFSTYVLNRLS